MGAIIRTCSHLESWRPPASQLSIAVSAPNSFDERIIREIIEFKKVAIARPARIKEIFELLEANFDKEKTRIAAITPPIKEKKGNTKIDNEEKPKAIDITAPVAAPEETPIMLGSAIGFLKIP